jgi:CRP/FNR family transcriptional regulator, cyclic AMP receptor protein
MKKSKRTAFDSKIFLAKVGDGKTISKYQKNQIVFSQGDVADAAFYIQRGKIKLTVVSERGKEAVVGILEPGHFFGEGCLNGHPLRVTTATAIEQSLITRIPRPLSRYAHCQRFGRPRAWNLGRLQPQPKAAFASAKP